MSTKVGGIGVTLTTSVGAFAKGLKAAGAHVNAFVRGTDSAGARMRSMGIVGTSAATAIGSAFGTFVAGAALSALRSFSNMLRVTVRYLHQLFNTQRHVIDEISKLSRELGISVESLQQFRLAASLAGTPIEVLQRGLQILTRRIGEAQSGTGEAVKAFETMGLSAQSLGEMGTENAFWEIQKRIAAMSNETDQAAAAFMLFSRQGVQLLNFLKDGSKDFEEIGILMRATGAATQEDGVFSTKGVEKMNDAIEKIKVLVDFVAQGLIIQMAPALLYLQDLSLNWVKTFADGQSIAQIITEKLAAGIIYAAEGVVALTANFLDFGSIALQKVGEIFFGLSMWVHGAANVVSAFEVVGKVLQSIATIPVVFIRGLVVVKDYLVGLASNVGAVWDAISGKISIKEAMDRMAATGADGLESLTTQISKVGEDFKTIWSADGKLDDTLSNMAGGLEGLERGARRGAAGIEKMSARVKGLAGKPTEAIKDFVADANAHMADVLFEEGEAGDPFLPIRESAEKTKNFIADTFKAGELGLLVTNSLATDLKFLEDAAKIGDKMADDLDDMPGMDNRRASKKPPPTREQMVVQAAQEGAFQVDEGSALASLDGGGDSSSSEAIVGVLREILSTLRGGIPATVG